MCKWVKWKWFGYRAAGAKKKIWAGSKCKKHRGICEKIKIWGLASAFPESSVAPPLMLGSGGIVSLGIERMVGNGGTLSWGIVGIEGKGGNVVGIEGNVGFGKVGMRGKFGCVVVCKRLRASRLMFDKVTKRSKDVMIEGEKNHKKGGGGLILFLENYYFTL